MMNELQNFINGEMFSAIPPPQATTTKMVEPEKGIDVTVPKVVAEEEKVPLFNVYLNYNSFTMMDFAVNHYNQHQVTSSKMTLRFGKKKTFNWSDMLQHTKVRCSLSM